MQMQKMSNHICSATFIVVLCKAGLNTIEVLLWARGKSLKDVRRRLQNIHESVVEWKEDEEDEREEQAMKMIQER